MNKRFRITLTSIGLIASLMFGACGQVNTPATSESASAADNSTAASSVASEESPSPASGEPALDISKREKMVLYRGGSPTPGEAAVIQLLQDQTKDIINCDIEIVATPWSDYNTKLTLMTSTGDPMDAFSIWKGGEGPFVSKPGFVAPLDDLLAKYGQNIKKAVPEDAFKYVTYSDKIISIPQMFPEMRVVMCVRMDLLKQAGIETVPADFAELETALMAVKAKFPDAIISSAGDYRTIDFTGYFDLIGKGIRMGDMNYYYDEEKKSFAPLIGNETYVKQRNVVQRWYKNGLIDRDAVMRNSDQYGQMLNSGKLVYMGAPWIDGAAAIKSAVPEADLQVMNWTIGNTTQPAPYQNQILIPEQSKIKERVIKLFDWVWSSQDNYNLVMYGVENKDFLTKDGKISYPEGITAATSEFPSPWDTLFQNNNLFLFNAAWDPIVESMLRTQWDYKGYAKNDLAGFNPDMSEFKDVIPTETRYVDEYRQKTLTAVATVEDATKEFLDNWMKNCKGQAQLDALNKQYETWLASSK